MIGRHRSAIGLALSRTRAVTCTLGREGARPEDVSTHDWSAADPDRRARLTAILRAASGSAGATALHVALLPPLADVRIVTLPALDTDDLRPALARDLRRYFPLGPEAHVVQVEASGAATDGAPSPHLVTVATEALVDDLLGAAKDAGLTARSVAASIHAWDAASRAGGEGSRPVVARGDGWEVRFTRAGSSLATIRRKNGTVTSATAGDVLLATDEQGALRAAASHAAVADARSLWPARMYAERTASLRRGARRCAIAAGLLLLLAGAVEWRSFARMERDVSASRAAIRARVATAMDQRDSLAALQGALARLSRFEPDGTPWLSVLVGLERALPEDASILSLRGNADTVVIVGEAERAAPVLEALGRASVLASVRADAPIQQEVDQGEVIAERFTALGTLRGKGERP